MKRLPTPGHANGLAFSVNPGVRPPRSLANILAELAADTGERPASGDLSPWAAQGVLLMNTALSVAPGAAGAHAGWGWDRLARQAIAAAQEHGELGQRVPRFLDDVDGSRQSERQHWRDHARGPDL